MFQNPVPLLNRSPISLLAVPPAAESEIVGKSAAIAAPIFAFDALSWSSACFVGAPLQQLRGQAGRDDVGKLLLRQRQAARQVSRQATQQHTELVFLLGLLPEHAG